MSTPAFDAISKELPVDSGVARKDRKVLAGEMGQALASMYVLYHKTHAYHWNVTGPMFYSVHKLTDDQYQDLAAAIDDVAERIRAIGFLAPVGLGAYMKDSVIEDAAEVRPAADMVKELAADHQALAKQLRAVVERAEEAEDVFTADLLTARIGAHEEASWMLNALVVDETA